MTQCINVEFLPDGSATFTASIQDSDGNEIARDCMMYTYLRGDWAEYPGTKCLYKDVSRAHVQQHLEEFYAKHGFEIDPEFCKNVEKKCHLIETGVITTDDL